MPHVSEKAWSPDARHFRCVCPPGCGYLVGRAIHARGASSTPPRICATSACRRDSGDGTASPGGRQSHVRNHEAANTQNHRRWDASQFTASDDRVRGGKSQSYLTVLPAAAPSSSSQAEFSGHLDITALGGAGFASQRTADGVAGWDVSAYDALVLDVAHADSRRYTLTLKDEVLPRRPDGRDQSTVSWEYDFVVGADGGGSTAGAGGSTRVVIPFGEFKPTYRGKPKPDAEPLDLKNVKRISFMMRR